MENGIIHLPKILPKSFCYLLFDIFETEQSEILSEIMENPEASIISTANASQIRSDSIATAADRNPDNSFSTSLNYRNIYGEECVQNHTSELKFSNPLEIGSRIVAKLNF